MLMQLDWVMGCSVRVRLWDRLQSFVDLIYIEILYTTPPMHLHYQNFYLHYRFPSSQQSGMNITVLAKLLPPLCKQNLNAEYERRGSSHTKRTHRIHSGLLEMLVSMVTVCHGLRLQLPAVELAITGS